METSLVFEILGTTGSLILCASAIPQIVKTYRTKSSGDLSFMYLATLMLGLMLLMVYSLYVKDFVFIFGNTLALSSTGVMILFWFKYRIQG
jgi:MtN3 and saliva related transmembrane protein